MSVIAPVAIIAFVAVATSALGGRRVSDERRLPGDPNSAIASVAHLLQFTTLVLLVGGIVVAAFGVRGAR